MKTLKELHSGGVVEPSSGYIFAHRSGSGSGAHGTFMVATFQRNGQRYRLNHMRGAQIVDRILC